MVAEKQIEQIEQIEEEEDADEMVGAVTFVAQVLLYFLT